MALTLDGLQAFGGGGNSNLNVTSDTVIKSTAGRFIRAIVNTTSVGAAVTINDAATVAGVSSGNTILTIPVGATAGTIYYCDFPCQNGIVAKVGSATISLAISSY